MITLTQPFLPRAIETVTQQKSPCFENETMERRIEKKHILYVIIVGAQRIGHLSSGLQQRGNHEAFPHRPLKLQIKHGQSNRRRRAIQCQLALIRRLRCILETV